MGCPGPEQGITQPFSSFYDESWAARALHAPVWQDLAFAVQWLADFGLRSLFWHTLTIAPFVLKRIPSLYFFRDGDGPFLVTQAHAIVAPSPISLMVRE